MTGNAAPTNEQHVWNARSYKRTTNVNFLAFPARIEKFGVFMNKIWDFYKESEKFGVPTQGWRQDLPDRWASSPTGDQQADDASIKAMSCQKNDKRKFLGLSGKNWKFWEVFEQNLGFLQGNWKM